MKKSLFFVLFIAMVGITSYQCQKSNVVPNNQGLTTVEQSLTDRGAPCPMTVTSTVGGNVCGTTSGTGTCLTCGGHQALGAANFAANVPYTFETANIIFSVRNNTADTGKYSISNTNGVIDFELLAGECADFYLSGCDIIRI